MAERIALLIDENDEIVNRIVLNDANAYMPEKGLRVLFEDEAKKNYEKDKDGNVLFKDIGDAI